MSTFHKLSSMLLPTFPCIQVNIAVFSRNRAGVKNRNRFKEKKGKCHTQFILNANYNYKTSHALSLRS